MPTIGRELPPVEEVFMGVSVICFRTSGSDYAEKGKTSLNSCFRIPVMPSYFRS